METQCSVQSQAFEQATAPETPRTMSVKQLNNNPATSICLGVTEIILRVFSTVSPCAVATYITGYIAI